MKERVSITLLFFFIIISYSTIITTEKFKYLESHLSLVFEPIGSMNVFRYILKYERIRSYIVFLRSSLEGKYLFDKFTFQTKNHSSEQQISRIVYWYSLFCADVMIDVAPSIFF